MMSLLLEWGTQPLSLIFVLLMLASVVALAGRLRKLPLAPGKLPAAPSTLPVALGCVPALAVLWLTSAPGPVNALVHAMEPRPDDPSRCDETDAHLPLVILGGGLDSHGLSSASYEILHRDSLLRTFKAFDVADDESTLYLLGGGSAARKLANLMRDILQRLGIEPGRLIVETGSSSTLQNAQALDRLLPAANAPGLQLVSSALHVPRAVATFEKLGYRVCHHATDSLYAPATMPVAALPHIDALNKSTSVIREIVARLVYRLRGHA